jgi:hypothetical protein
MHCRITIHLGRDLATWLDSISKQSGLSRSRIVEDMLEEARSLVPARTFLRLAGKVRGSKNLSEKKGFSRR